MAASEIGSVKTVDAPRQADLDKCVHCGLCLNACPTYRELHVEMDSPRGRIYQMVQVAAGAPITESYVEHIDLCLACRACETACPSGVEYGRLVEAARADIENRTRRPWSSRILRHVVFENVLPGRFATRLAAIGLGAIQALRLKLPGRLGELMSLAPKVERPFFYSSIGRVFAGHTDVPGERKYRVAFLSGCIANVCFARLNEATVRVLQDHGCEVTIPAQQTCCGALHVHAGLRDSARRLARQNIDAVLSLERATGDFDAIITNAAGCGSTLKEYDELLDHDAEYADRARGFVARMRDVTEFLASIEPNAPVREVRAVVTYQDSCHLAHGQRIRSAPRELLRRVPGLVFKEMAMADSCCGSAGIYNVVHTDMSMALLEKKMAAINATGADRIVTANPGCMLQLRAGVERWGRGQRVSHVVEILDEAFSVTIDK
jgi:glycolate oxidase iron-sulfur subunit